MGSLHDVLSRKQQGAEKLTSVRCRAHTRVVRGVVTRESSRGQTDGRGESLPGCRVRDIGTPWTCMRVAGPHVAKTQKHKWFARSGWRGGKETESPHTTETRTQSLRTARLRPADTWDGVLVSLHALGRKARREAFTGEHAQGGVGGYAIWAYGRVTDAAAERADFDIIILWAQFVVLHMTRCGRSACV